VKFHGMDVSVMGKYGQLCIIDLPLSFAYGKNDLGNQPHVRDIDRQLIAAQFRSRDL